MRKKELYLISKNIKQLRIDANKTQKEVASVLGITYQSYQAYELGITLPNLENFIKLADYFEISLDELAGKNIR